MLYSAEPKPTMLQLLSFRDENGYEVRVIDEIASNWQEVAVALGIKNSTIKIIATDSMGNCRGGCIKMMATWVDSGNDVSWAHLIEALVMADSEYNALAEDIRYFMQ